MAYIRECRLSTPFQNRLVGTIIIAAIVIIFLPDILDGEKNANRTDFESLPDTPVFTGKLTDKRFPDEKLVKKTPEKLSDETAQDDTDAATTKEQVVDTSISNEQISPTSTVKVTPIVQAPTVKKALIEPVSQLPEKAVTKQAWVIHLGSFKHKQNVAVLLAKLKENGYTVFTRPIKTKQGVLTKVFIGPELIKSSLEKKLPDLKKLTNTQGKVALFEPIK